MRHNVPNRKLISGFTIIVYLLLVSKAYASFFGSGEIRVKVIKTYEKNQTIRRGKKLDIPIKILILSTDSAIAPGEKKDIILEAPADAENKIKTGSILVVKYEYGNFDPPPDGSDTSFESWYLLKILH